MKPPVVYLLLSFVALALFSACALRKSSDTLFPIERAAVDAERDLASGAYKLIYAGMPWPTYWAERDILRREYGIELISTCDPGYAKYGRRYNEIALPAIEHRFGTNLLMDILRRAQALTAEGAFPTSDQ